MANTADRTNDLLIPAPLQAEIRAMAAIAHRPPSEIVREALESYLAHQHAGSLPQPDAARRAASAAHMRERRKGRILPADTTIEGMIAHGRA